MDDFADSFKEFLYDWARFTGLSNNKTKFVPQDFLKEPEAIAACIAIYEDPTVSTAIQEQAEHILNGKGVTVIHQFDKPTKFLVPTTTGSVEIDSNSESRRTLQQLALLPDLFTLSPANRKFINGKSEFLAASPGWIRLVLAFVLFLFAVIVWLTTIKWLSILILVISILTAYKAITAILTQRDYAKNAQPLQGQLITYTGRWIRHVETFEAASLYRVSLTYVVKFPDGVRRFGGNHANFMIDQQAKPGEPGMPIAVLYHPDNQQINLL